MGFSLVVAWFSLSRLWRAGSREHGLCSLRHAGALAEAHKLSSCGAGLVVGSYFPDPGSNPHPLHCTVDSLPLDHQGSP